MNKVISVSVFYNAEMYMEKHFISLIDNSIDKIIIVDNASNDNTISKLNTQQEHILIKNEINEGFANACNKGILEALKYKPEYLLLINQDAHLNQNCLSKLLSIAEKTDFSLYSPMHYYAKDKLDKSFSKYIGEKDIKTDFAKVDFVNAACWLIPCETIKRVGLFDPLFFFTGEDIDYFNRLKYFNLEAVVVKKALMIHDRDQNKSLNSKEHILFEKSLEADFIQRLKNVNEAWHIGVLKCLGHLLRMLIKTRSYMPLKVMLRQIINPTIFKHRKYSKEGTAFLPSGNHG